MRSRLLPPLLAMALLSGCARSGPVEAAAPASPPTVPVAKVEVQDLSHDLVLTAEFRPFQEIDLMAKAAGFIKEIRVDAGDRVQQGQPIATLEVPEMQDDLRRANAAMQRSNAEVRRADDEMNRAEGAHAITHATLVLCRRHLMNHNGEGSVQQDHARWRIYGFAIAGEGKRKRPAGI